LIRKPVNELHFVHARDPLQTVEIDLDTLPDGMHGYGQLVEAALSPLASTDSDLRATVYIYHGPSVSFGNYGYSAFFALAGDPRVRGALYGAFHGTAGLRVRHGDQIDPAQALPQYHLEDGRLWCPDEEYVWYAHGGDGDSAAAGEASEGGEEDAKAEENDAEYPDDGPDVGADEDWPEDSGDTAVAASGGHTELPARFRAARSDASVGTICRRIEAVFGLPEGAVALRGPDKKVLRSDATIRTLRRRWE
jgi:hypothetical protein